MDNPDLSLLFYRYSCNVFGTEEVVRARRQIYTAIEDVTGDGETLCISSGSKSEGLHFDGSDFDFMEVENHMPVYENSYAVKRLPGNCPLVMDIYDCKPGYSQLKIVHQPCNLIKMYGEYKAGEWYMSSEKYREWPRHIRERPNLVTHGPCKSWKDVYDFAYCLRSKDWISNAHSWLSRSQQQLVSDNVIDTIVDFGVLFVPVGCKNSQYVDLEWRISISYAEKLLIWSFNHIQLMCYALLKVLLKEVIKHFSGDLLCSYYLKTIMFWVCEETKSHQWEAKQFLSCFMSCLDRLIYCVEYKTCVHYFIPENDLFDNRFNRQQHRILLSTLNRLQSLGWTCLLQTQTLESFQSFLLPSLSPVLYCHSYLQSVDILDSLNFQNSLSKMKRAVYHSMRSKKSNIYIHLISIVNQVWAQTLTKQTLIRSSGNKQLYNIHQELLSHLLVGVNTDVVSGWLLLASFFYGNKQYHICRKIVSNCLLRCTPDKYIVKNQLSKDDQTPLELLRRYIKTSPWNFLRKYTIRLVHFNSCTQILPKEMDDMFEHGGNILVSPVPFGLFLQYICNHHLGNQIEKVRCLRVLNAVVQNKLLFLHAGQLEIVHMLISLANSLKDVNNHH